MKTGQMKRLGGFFIDLLCAVSAGLIVGSAYFFFQNSNGFAPGGVGGLATLTHYFLQDAVSSDLRHSRAVLPRVCL